MNKEILTMLPICGVIAIGIVLGLTAGFTVFQIIKILVLKKDK